MQEVRELISFKYATKMQLSDVNYQTEAHLARSFCILYNIGLSTVI